MQNVEFPRRRVLYIRHRRIHEISDGLRMNQDEWVETMSMLADVSVISDDFDLDEAGTRLQPDFILYEAPILRAAPLNIANPKAHAHIPRFALQIQDAYCSIRVEFLRTVETLNVQWIFTHMADMVLRLSPELKSRVFSLPHMFDDRVFRDYGLAKDIPVSIFGAHLVPDMYHWRAEIVAHIAEYFPTLLYTHPGYAAPIPRHKFSVAGVDYAKLLNRSYFSLADTSRFDCFLRKHVEIPASGAVLVAPDTPCLKPYGFRDMENCILGSGKALYDKIAAVAENPQAYEKIRKSGYDLVHARYKRENWRGILDFYECLRGLKPGETIRQEKILGPFKAVAAAQASPDAVVEQYPDNETSNLQKMWLHNLTSGEEFEAIEKKTLELSRWLSHVTEIWLPMGIAALLQGDAARARDFFLRPQSVRQREAGFDLFDPEEIAWLSLTAALSGDAELLQLTWRESAGMRHLSLRRMQWLGTLMAGADPARPPVTVCQPAANDRLSIHWTGRLAIEDWLDIVRRILRQHRQNLPEAV